MAKSLPAQGIPTRDIAEAARDELLAQNDPPRLFGHPSGPVCAGLDFEGLIKLEPIDQDLLHAELNQIIDWEITSTRGTRYVDCPSAVTRHVLHSRTTRLADELPQLKRVIHTPLILEDGRILAASGYDAASQILVSIDANLILANVPEAPTESDSQVALAVLDDVLRDFNFASPADHDNALGFLITHPLRSLMGELPSIPLFGVNSPKAGSGKGLLVKVASILATGQPAKSQSAAGADEDEWRKRLTTWLGSGQEFVHLDNVKDPINDPSLNALLTTAVWADRKLGSNELLRLPVHATFCATGNNLRLLGDTARRSVPILIDAGVEQPELREFERDEDGLLAYVKAQRGKLLAAVFTLARYWQKLGQPTLTRVIMGSFQRMVTTVGSVLAAAGRTAFMGNQASTRVEDDDQVQWRTWLRAWFDLYGSERQYARVILQHVHDMAPGHLALRELLPDSLAKERLLSSSTLGYALRDHSHQNPFGNLWLRSEDDRNSTKLWWVEEVVLQGPPTVQTGTPRARVEETVFAGDAGDAGDVSRPPATGENTSVDITKRVARVGKKRSPASPASPAESTTTARYACAQDARALQAFVTDVLRVMPPHLAVDTETTGLHPWEGDRVRLIQLAYEDTVMVVDVWALPVALAILRPLLEGHGPCLAMHNAKFDLGMLKAAGMGMPKPARIFDTYIASAMLDNADGQRPTQTLKALAERYLGRELPKEMQKSDWSADTLTEQQLAYAAEDARATYDLAVLLKSRLAKEGLHPAYDIEMAVVPIIVDLGARGVRIDPELWAPLAEKAEFHLAEFALEMQSLAGDQVNWRSPAQLLKVLAQRGIVLESTDESYLRDHQDDAFVAALLGWREWYKGSTTYGTSVLKALDDEQRFHAEYNQADTRTGRMTANIIHQIPRVGGYRQAVRPIEGRCLVKADYKQLQLVIVADLADDRTMIQAFSEGGTDIHTQTASRVLGVAAGQVSAQQRQWAKALNFGLVFGAGASTLMVSAKRDYGVEWTLEEATILRDKFFFTYPGVRRWHREDQHQRDEPLDIQVRSGRRRTGVQRFTRRLNTPVQMLEVDGVKAGLVTLESALKAEGLDAYIVMLVHDEVDLDSSVEHSTRVAELTQTCLEDGMNQWLKRARATIDVDIYRDWAGTPLTIEEPVGE